MYSDLAVEGAFHFIFLPGNEYFSLYLFYNTDIESLNCAHGPHLCVTFRSVLR